MQVELLIFKKAGNSYKKTPYHIGPDKFCDYFEKSRLSAELIAASDFPEKGVCPWPKKKYTIRGFLLPTDKVPDFFDGDYMYEFHISQKGKLLNGFMVYLTVLKV